MPDGMDLSRLAYDLTMSTVEVEGMTELARQFDHIVVGVVKEIISHPNTDKLRICKADIGAGNIQDIVCGGSNLQEGMKVAVACPGAMVRWHGKGEPVEIKNAKLRDVESYGMICASLEIGLFDLFPTSEETAILDLSTFDAQAGTPLADALGLDDIILEIDNKSLTNRPDLWGHYGIAREIAALYDLPLIEIEPFVPQVASDFTVHIEDSLRCPRYIGVQIEGLSAKPSPFEVQSRIWRVGMPPINALVDITNFVMLATGQPTHAFDSDNIQGHITVRLARENEKLLLLNGKELSLTSNDLVIADDETAVGLAGVMGGAKDSVLPSTEKIILEIANFDAMSVRRTALRYETRTEAATRYEKSIDPERCDIALSIALQLFAQLYPNMNIVGFHDNYQKQLEKSVVDVSLNWLRKRLGKDISNDYIADKLGRLGFNINFNADTMHIVAPTWRSTGDISIPDDIMEEVARMYGFENFEPTPITTSFTGAINQIEVDIERKIKEYLAFRCGMREIFTYPWMSDDYVNAILQTTDDILSLVAPPSPNERYIRSSLLPNLCKAVAGNQRFFNEFAIFESAQVLFDANYSTPYDARERLPMQRRNIAGALVGEETNVNIFFRKAKGIIEAMPRYVHIEPITFERQEQPVWADSTLWINIIHGGQRIGNLALLSKKKSLDCGIKNSAVMLFEIDIELIKSYLSRTNSFLHLPEFPIANCDISLLFDLSVKWGDIKDVIKKTHHSDELLRDVLFIDEYRGKQVPDNKKSVTVRLMIGSLKKTLTSDEINGFINLVATNLKDVIGGEIRG